MRFNALLKIILIATFSRCTKSNEITRLETVFEIFSYGEPTAYGLFIGDDISPNRSDLADKEHYKHPIVNKWEEASINKIRLHVISAGKIVAGVEFDARGSNRTSWMSPENIIGSTYTDIRPSGNDTDYTCSVEGIPLKNGHRRFYINRKTGDCENQIGWIKVMEGHPNCSFESGDNSFLSNGVLVIFVPGTKALQWTRGRIADSLRLIAVYVDKSETLPAVYNASGDSNESTNTPVSKDNLEGITETLTATSGQDTAETLPATSGQDTTETLTATSGQDTTKTLTATSGQDTAETLTATSGQDTTETLTATSGQDTTETLTDTSGQDTAETLTATSGQDTTETLTATSGQDTTETLSATSGQDTTETLTATSGQDTAETLPATSGQDTTETLPATSVQATTETLPATPIRITTDTLPASSVQDTTETLPATPIRVTPDTLPATSVQDTTETLLADSSLSYIRATTGQDKCSCIRCKTTPVNMSVSELQEVVQELQEKLKVNKKKLSSTFARLNSADDPRPSAKALGVVFGGSIFATVFGVLVLPDIYTFLLAVYKLLKTAFG